MTVWDLKCECGEVIRLAFETPERGFEILKETGWDLIHDDRPRIEKIADAIKAYQEGRVVCIKAKCPNHMNEDERSTMIVKLQRLDAQVRNAIDYLQRGLPLYPVERPNPNETPNTFHIGDFTITDRFTEPH